jgi:hypothetical protein
MTMSAEGGGELNLFKTVFQYQIAAHCPRRRCVKTEDEMRMMRKPPEAAHAIQRMTLLCQLL